MKDKKGHKKYKFDISFGNWFKHLFRRRTCRNIKTPKMHLVEIGQSLVDYARKDSEKELQKLKDEEIEKVL